MAGAGASSSWAQRAQVGATLPAYQNVSDWGWQAQQGYALETAAAVNEQRNTATGFAIAIGVLSVGIVLGGIALLQQRRQLRALAGITGASILELSMLKFDLRSQGVSVTESAGHPTRVLYPDA